MSNSTAEFHTFSPIRTDLAAHLVDALESANDGADGDGSADDSALLKLWDDDEEMRQTMLDEGCDLSKGRSGCPHSDSMLLLVALSATDLRGTRLRPFDDGRTRDRLGRFPWGDENPLSYFRTFTSNPTKATDNSNGKQNEKVSGSGGKGTDSGTDAEETQSGSDAKQTRGGSDAKETHSDPSTDCLGLVTALDTRLTEGSRGHSRFSSGSYGTLYGWLDHEEVRTLENLLAKGSYRVSADEPLDGGAADVARNLTMVLRAAQKEGAGIIHFSH